MIGEWKSGQMYWPLSDDLQLCSVSLQGLFGYYCFISDFNLYCTILSGKTQGFRLNVREFYIVLKSVQIICYNCKQNIKFE